MNEITLAFLTKRKGRSAIGDFFNAHFGGFESFMSLTIPDTHIVEHKEWRKVVVKSRLTAKRLLELINAEIKRFGAKIQVLQILSQPVA